MTDSTRQIWNVRLGPCFCGVRPGKDGSFDLHRWQISHVSHDELAVNLLVTTAEVPEHVAGEIERTVGRHRPDWMVVTHRICPYARRAGAVGPGIPVERLTTVDRALQACMADRPDQLALALLNWSAPQEAVVERRLVQV